AVRHRQIVADRRDACAEEATQILIELVQHRMAEKTLHRNVARWQRRDISGLMSMEDLISKYPQVREDEIGNGYDDHRCQHAPLIASVKMLQDDVHGADGQGNIDQLHQEEADG